LPILAQKLSRIGDWGGSNLDANSLQSGSVLDAIQHLVAPPHMEFRDHGWLDAIHVVQTVEGD
jgi:hypothetical protein